MVLNIGHLAPPFILPDSDAKLVSLSSFKGKWVILYFYPKDNTPGCTLEALTFTKNQDDFNKMGAIILGISADSLAQHCKFRDKYHLTITLLSDPAHETIEKYGAWQKKNMYARLFWGIQRMTFLIDPSGKIAYVWSKVKVSGHSQEVFSKLKELSK